MIRNNKLFDELPRLAIRRGGIHMVNVAFGIRSSVECIRQDVRHQTLSNLHSFDHASSQLYFTSNVIHEARGLCTNNVDNPGIKTHPHSLSHRTRRFTKTLTTKLRYNNIRYSCLKYANEWNVISHYDTVVEHVSTVGTCRVFVLGGGVNLSP